MREILKLSLLLAVITALCTGGIATVFQATKTKRELAGEQKKTDAVKRVIPKGVDLEPTLAITKFDGVIATNFAFYGTDGKLLATAIETSSENGYGGKITIITGIDATDDSISDYCVIQALETPGLGEKIASDEFRSGIRTCNLDTNFKVRKDGGQIDAITSATISSRAVLEAIREAVKIHREIVQNNLRPHNAENNGVISQ